MGKKKQQEILHTTFVPDGKLECGVDEAGRGCLAGPVYAAAVILPLGYSHPLLNDSKQLTERERLELRLDIERDALAYHVASASAEEIDQINILRATYLAMHRAISGLSIRPERLLIDGNRFAPYADIEHHCIVKGDATLMSIAAASILAKTYRDEAMIALSADYPHYGWQRHKGYPTPQHRAAIKAYGVSPYHRKSFRLLDEPGLFGE